VQVGETEPFISELLGELTSTIQDLETHQIHMFYEAVGLMISADSDAKKREHYLVSEQAPIRQSSQIMVAAFRGCLLVASRDLDDFS
jgi:exportin-1